MKLVRGDFATQTSRYKIDVMFTIVTAFSSNGELVKKWLVLRCYFRIIHGLFVGIYGALLSLVIPDENQLQVQ